MKKDSEPIDVDELRNLLAEFLLLDEEQRDFEAWVLEHPDHQAELREAYRDWQEGGALLEAHCEPRGAPAIQQLESGSTLGDFRLVRYLGRGGQGTVWEAE